MKKFYLLVAILTAATSLTSCVTDEDTSLNGTENTLPITGEGNVEFKLVAQSSSLSTRGDAEYPSGSNEITKGLAAEYKVNQCKVFLFNSSDKKLFKVIDLQNISDPISGSGNDQYMYYTTQKEQVDAGTYDILAIANPQKSLPETQGTSMETILDDIDSQTYTQGVMQSVPEKGFVMTNRGAENQNTVVSDKTSDKSVTTTITISLERVVARVDVTASSVDQSAVSCADITLEDYTLVNLPTKFYTYRHVAAVISQPTETPTWSFPSNYTTIPTQNGYVWDPNFLLKKAQTNATAYKTATKGIFVNRLVDIDENTTWSTIDATHNYILENCMYKDAQYYGNSTGIEFRGVFKPKADCVLTLNETQDGFVKATNWENSTLYYFNYKFYTTVEALRKATNRSTLIITNETTDESLADMQIYRYHMINGAAQTYYVYMIRHLDNSDSNVMADMEFGIVRNHIYNVNVTQITNLGPGSPITNPEPRDEGDSYLNVELNVRPWVVVNNDVVL